MFRRPLFLRCTASSITGRITLMESIVNGTPAVDAHRSHLHDREDVHMPLIRVPLPAVKVAVPQSIAVEPQADVISEALTKAVLPQPEVTVPTPEVPVPTPEVTVPTAAHEETPKVEMALATDALKSNGTAETANATTMIVSNSFTAPEVINVPVVEPLTVQTVAAVPPTLAAEKSTREASAVVVSVPVVEPPIVVPAVLPIPPHMIPTKLPLLDAKFTRLRKRMVSDHLRHMTAAAAAKRAGLPPPAHELRFVAAVQKLYKKKLPPNADELAVVLERKIASDTAATWATAKHGQYMHIDMDMFFAAVELRDDPLLAAKPFVVANKGMIVCADYKARQFGIRTGTPVSYAKRHCPSLVAVEGDMKKYAAASEHFKQILRDYDPHMRGFGLDEATLDLGPFLASLNDAPDRAVRLADLCTKCSLPPPSQHAMTTNVSLVSLALAIRHRVMAETQLPCSIGTAPTFALAKMAADSQKPLGATHLPADREAISAFMLTQNVADIIGVGPRAQETLALVNVFTVKDAYAQRVRLQQLLKKDSFTFLMRATAGLHAPLTSSDTSRASVAMKDDVDEPPPPPPPGPRRSSRKRKTVGRMVSVLQPRKRAALSKAHTKAPDAPLAALHLDKTPSPLSVERSATIRRSAALDANAARANKRRTRSVPVVTVPVPGTPTSAATATAPSPDSVRHKVKLTFAFAFPSVDLTTGEHDAHLDGFTREVMKVVPTLKLPSPQHLPTTDYPVVPVPRVAPLPNSSASSDDISRVIAKTMRIATPPTLLEDSNSSTRRSARTTTIVTATDVSAEAATTSKEQKEAKKSKATSRTYPKKVPTVTTLPAIVVPVPTLPAVVTKAPKAVAKRPRKVTKTAPAARPHTVDTTTVSVVTSSFYPVPAEAKVEAVGALTPNMSVDQRVTTTLAVGQSAIQELHFSPFSARTVTVTVKVYAASADSHNVQRPSYVLHSASASLHTASRDATELISLVKHAVKDIHQLTETALPEDLSRLAGVKVVLHDLYRTNVESRRMLW